MDERLERISKAADYVAARLGERRPLVGIVLGITNQNCGKQKSAKAYITAAVIAWVSWFFLVFMFGIFAAVFG